MEVSASFLPAIVNTMPNNHGNTGMTGVRTGESFIKSRRNTGMFQAQTGRASPMRAKSIVALLSPREMVKQFSNRGADDNFGI